MSEPTVAPPQNRRRRWLIGTVVVGFGFVVGIMLVLSQQAKGPYDSERGRWSLMCAGLVGPPAPTFSEEFSGQSTPQTRALFDDYLLTESPDDFPSPVRADLVALGQADRDYRSGRISGPQENEAGAAALAALSEQHERGACSWFTS